MHVWLYCCVQTVSDTRRVGYLFPARRPVCESVFFNLVRNVCSFDQWDNGNVQQHRTASCRSGRRQFLPPATKPGSRRTSQYIRHSVHRCWKVNKVLCGEEICPCWQHGDAGIAYRAAPYRTRLNSEAPNKPTGQNEKTGQTDGCIAASLCAPTIGRGLMMNVCREVVC